MKFADHVSKEQKKQLDKISPKKEQLSERELRELRGEFNRGLRRKKGGALSN